MDLSRLLHAPEDELERALERDEELSAPVADDARVLVRRAPDGGYAADLRVEGATVVRVEEDELDRFRQRLREQIAIHVPRDELPDLREP